MSNLRALDNPEDPISTGDPHFGETSQIYDGEADSAAIIKANNMRRVYKQNGLPWPPPDTLPPPEPPVPAGDEPTLISLDPASAECGSEDFTLHCNGANFNDTSVIVWNGGEEPTVFVSDAELTTIVRASLATVAMDIPVFIRTDGIDGGGLGFRFTEPQ
jgi:hypothetical protein